MAEISLTTLGLAALGGIVPTFLWLWFWLGEDKKTGIPEPHGLVVLTYLSGVIAVPLLLSLHGLFAGIGPDSTKAVIIFAIAEELVKVGLVALIAFKSRFIDEPTDYAIYLVTGAIGFSALENTLYLLQTADGGNIAGFLLASNMRFLGATLLHTVTVAVVGISMGLAFGKSRAVRLWHCLIGLLIGTALHATFNYLILVDTRQSLIETFAGLWFVALIVILAFQRLKDLHVYKSPTTPYVQ